MKFINLGGRERPFKFGFNAIDIFCREYEIGISAFSEQFAKIAKGEATPGVLRDIIYSGLIAGTQTYNETPDFNKYSVGDWLDELASEELAGIMKTVTESMTNGGKKKSSSPGNLTPAPSPNGEGIWGEVTFDDLIKQSARAGLKPSEFWQMDLREWSNYMDGVQLREEDKWRHTREIMAAVYNCFGGNKIKGNELIQLASENKEKTEPSRWNTTTLDERLNIAMRYKNCYKL